MDSQTLTKDLYPSFEPYQSGMLDVGDGHTLYWEQSGNPNGVPVIFLHGGPGAGCSPAHRRFFDPAYYRIVLFDQRGCGKSTPFANLHCNTTGHLVADIETLRQHLKIESWLVFGGSWGSTLALAYGIGHAAHCLGFILRGIFLGTASELDWFIQGIATIFPEAHRDLKNFLPHEEQDDLIGSYFCRLNDPDPDIHLPAAAMWSRYESICSTLLPGPLAKSPPPKRQHTPTMSGMLPIARLEVHYFRNNMFLEEDFIINNLDKLSGLKATIVQGRYDIICPPVSADKLAHSWPGGTDAISTVIVNDAGHSAMEPGIRKALIQAADSFRVL